MITTLTACRSILPQGAMSARSLSHAIRRVTCLARLGVACSCLTACSLFPAVAPPTPEVPAVWQTATTTMGPTQPVPDRWWSLFQNTELDRLLEHALQNAPDRQLASSRIAEARAQRQNAAAQLFPLVQGVAGIDRTHGSDNNGRGQGSGGTSNNFEAGFDASWELDLFGRNRKTLEAARATEEASVADRQAVTLSLIAEIVRQYTLYSLYQTQVQLAQDSAKTQSGVFKISQARYAQGLDSRLELSRAQNLVQATEAQVPLYQNLTQATAYQIDYLLGDRPGVNQAVLAQHDTIPVIQRDVFLDVPLTIIRQRPDIRIAEQNLIAATAITQATIITLYPTVTVSGVLGLTSSTAGRLVSFGSNDWSVGGSLIAPLFDFGRIRSNIDIAKARQQQAYLNYQQTVLAALRDVETTAYAYQKSKERYAKLNEALHSSQQAVSVARRQYQEGILSQLDVLQAEQNSYATQQDTAQAAADLTQNFIALCKALGLGLASVPVGVNN